LFAYIIMPKYEISLEDYLEKSKTSFMEMDDVCKIMSNVYEALEQLH